MTALHVHGSLLKAVMMIPEKSDPAPRTRNDWQGYLAVFSRLVSIWKETAPVSCQEKACHNRNLSRSVY